MFNKEVPTGRTTLSIKTIRKAINTKRAKRPGGRSIQQPSSNTVVIESDLKESSSASKQATDAENDKVKEEGGDVEIGIGEGSDALKERLVKRSRVSKANKSDPNKYRGVLKGLIEFIRSDIERDDLKGYNKQRKNAATSLQTAINIKGVAKAFIAPRAPKINDLSVAIRDLIQKFGANLTNIKKKTYITTLKAEGEIVTI